MNTAISVSLSLELTVLRLPPGFQAVGSEGCHHILNGVAVGVSELTVHPSGIAFKTLVFLKMDRDRDADVSGACETYSLLGVSGMKNTFMRTAGIQMFWMCTCYYHPLMHMTHQHKLLYTQQNSYKLNLTNLVKQNNIKTFRIYFRGFLFILWKWIDTGAAELQNGQNTL